MDGGMDEWMDGGMNTGTDGGMDALNGGMYGRRDG